MRIPAIAAAALILVLGVTGASRADDVKWLTNYEDALKQAKSEKKVILADFTGSDWCPWCIKLHDEVFKTKEFQDWAAKKVVLLELDFPNEKEQPEALKKQNQELQGKFKITGYPTVVFIDQDGKEKGRSGYLKGGPATWTAKADEILGKDAGAAKKDDAKKDAKGAKKDDSKKGDTAWLESWDKAAERAKKEKKLVLVNFTGSDWCPWCIKLHKEVFDTDDFKKWASQNAVLLELDFPHKKAQTDELKAANKKLQEKYKIEGFPTVLVLDADGNKVGELGYEEGGPSSWTKKAQEILDANKAK